MDVDPESSEIYLPLLQPDASGEKLSPRTALNEIWQEPPPAHRIHLVVTFTNRELSSNLVERLHNKRFFDTFS